MTLKEIEKTLAWVKIEIKLWENRIKEYKKLGGTFVLWNGENLPGHELKRLKTTQDVLERKITSLKSDNRQPR